jgi:L-amino acid N-acyltransferase YncA
MEPDLTAAVHVRPAVTADLAEIVRIYNTSIPGRLATADLAPVSVDDRAAWFAAHDQTRRPIWVAIADDTIVGWLSFSDFHPRAAYGATAEVSIYLDPAVHGRGLARFLLSMAIDRAPSLGIATLMGLIFGHNERSLELFASFGFATWGTLPRVCVLDGIDRDVVIVGRRLTP